MFPFPSPPNKSQVREPKTDSIFRRLEYKLTIKLGLMMAIAIGVLATSVKLSLR